MPHSQLAADRSYEITQVGPVAYIGQERAVLIVDCLPIGSVHFGVVEILALNPPRLTIDLRPLGAWIYLRLELRHIDCAVAHLGGAVCRNDSPAVSAGLIEEFLLVSRERVRANAFEERRGRSLLELVSLQARRRGRAARRVRFHIKDRPRRAGGEAAVVTSRNVDGQDSLSDPVEVNANGDGLRRVRYGPSRGFAA